MLKTQQKTSFDFVDIDSTKGFVNKNGGNLNTMWSWLVLDIVLKSCNA